MNNNSLSWTGKKWLISDEQQIPEGAQAAVHRIMNERGLADEHQSAYKLQSPHKLNDIEKACARIKDAIASKEHVLIFGDYDCDGITATAQMVRFFKRHHINADIRLPDRVKDGYGLTQSIVDEIISQKYTLIITVDTGITANEEVASIQGAGIDVIITDHHSIVDKAPDAFAIVHPMLSEDYDIPHPSGAGVVFQLVRALEGNTSWEDVHTDMSLAMMGTVADIVPLKGDNRTLVQMGLHALSHVTDGPLYELCSLTKVKPAEVTSTDIAFRFAPRINAAGRISDPTIALDGLLGNSEALEQLNTLNTQRQDETQDSFEGVVQSLKDEDGNLPLLLASIKESYGHGIVGLIAGKLTEAHGRPSLIATIENEVCTASLRSPPCFHVTEALHKHAHLLTRYGGHAQAAGCTFPLKNAEELIISLNKEIEKQVNMEDLVPSIHIDATITCNDISLSLCNTLRALEPFGEGNSEPRFLIKNVTLSDTRTVGREQNHLQCNVENIKAIGFYLAEHCSKTRNPVDIVARVGVNTWLNKKTPQLFIVDIRSAR